MSDLAESFREFKEIKDSIRNKKEPERIEFAIKQISRVWTNFSVVEDRMILRLPLGTITFYPFTGWFCGQKPYGKIKGRGINNLVAKIRVLIAK